jgi:glyoxylase-like metal-dependent hydrolase (beta-lactamase superfamily II)
MSVLNPVYRIGDVSITRIDELVLRGAQPATLYPYAGPGEWSRHVSRLGSGSVDPETGNLVQSIHSWLLRTPKHVILIDTATGNDKERPDQPALHRLQQPFLARLAAAGVHPAEVDYVLVSHIHSDHVGWNTVLRHGAWVPTFPNARHIVSAKENTYCAALDRGQEPDPEQVTPGLGPMRRRPFPGLYADSVLPVTAAGLVDFITVDGHEVVDGVSFLPTPGHSIDHASIRLASCGEEALFTGDIMHHPLQVYAPELDSCYCEFPEAAHRSRLWALNEAAERNIPLFTAHFAESSAGQVIHDGDGFAWSFI